MWIWHHLRDQTRLRQCVSLNKRKLYAVASLVAIFLMISHIAFMLQKSGYPKIQESKCFGCTTDPIEKDDIGMDQERSRQQLPHRYEMSTVEASQPTLTNKSSPGAAREAVRFLAGIPRTRLNQERSRQQLPHWYEMSTVEASQPTLTNKSSPGAAREAVRFVAGIPRTRLSKLCIGIPTMKRPKGDYFLSTLESLFNQTRPEERDKLTVVVMLTDRDPAHNHHRLQQLQVLYGRQLQTGLLLVVSAPNTDHLYQTSDLKRTFDDSLDRIRWRSKQNLDYAALMEISANLSTYYLQLEDDVTAAPNFMRHIDVFMQQQQSQRNNWAVLEFSNTGFIGKLFRNSDLPKLVTLLRTFYLEMPCDFIIGYYRELMIQKKVIARKGKLFFHQGVYSSLKNVVRKTEKPPSIQKSYYYYHQNPKGQLYSSLKVHKTHKLANAYDLTSTDFFWGANVNEGGYVTVVFDKPLKVHRVVVKTGLIERGALHDYARNATVHLGRKTSKSAKTVVCQDTLAVGSLTDGSLNTTVDAMDVAACLSLIINQSQTEWLAISQLVVFPQNTDPT